MLRFKVFNLYNFVYIIKLLKNGLRKQTRFIMQKQDIYFRYAERLTINKEMIFPNNL